MLNYFLYNSIIVTWYIQKGVNLVYMVDQTNKFQVMFQLPCSIFILINKVKRFSNHSRKYNFFNFFVNWSITAAKLFFEDPTQPGMMTDDTVRLVCVHMLLLREIFKQWIWQKSSKSAMVWTGDKSQTGLIKTKNCSTKISFITKLDITYDKSLAQLLKFMHILTENKIIFITK